MDIMNYEMLKAAGNVTMQKVAPDLVLVKIQKFDAVTGLRSYDTDSLVRIDAINMQYQQAKMTFEAFSALKADIDLLPNVVPAQ